jgi:hypothetical protein
LPLVGPLLDNKILILITVFKYVVWEFYLSTTRIIKFIRL